VTPVRDVPGVLVLHHHPPFRGAPDVIESVRAFRRHSAWPCWQLNTALGAPSGLVRLRFAAVVLHYTLFYAELEPLRPAFRAYLASLPPTVHLTAWFQDEQAYLGDRLAFCDEHGVSAVYTMLEAPYARQVYGSVAGVRHVETALPGYVSEALVAAGRRHARPDVARRIDIGYRGRRPPPSWGAEAREKYDIAVELSRRLARSGLRLDIETDEGRRLYGEDWYRFIGDCRGTLGTESGAVLLHAGRPVPYRTLSPRHLEAAALRSCQILFEGRYSGHLVADRHYLPLRKDYANLEEVVARFRDPEVRSRLTAAAHADLIASGSLSYRDFVAGHDRLLAANGLSPPAVPPDRGRIDAALLPSLPVRRWRRASSRLRIEVGDRVRRRPTGDG
jgi:hypothetical protein